MPLDTQGNLTAFRFSHLAGSVTHAVFTRLGGASEGHCASLNVGHTVGDDPVAVAENHRRIAAALDIHREEIVNVRQVHGQRVVEARAAHRGQMLADADALITCEARVYLMLRFADCVPILLYAPDVGAVGIVHAGWQGSAAGIASSTVQAMANAWGCRPEALRAGIGPSIGPCCYEVGPEVRHALLGGPGVTEGVVDRASAGDRVYANLWLANVEQLRAAGVVDVEVAGLCTRCRRDLFFSHRGDGGATGRFAALIGLEAEGKPAGLSR